jgi:hypothetical protein
MVLRVRKLPTRRAVLLGLAAGLAMAAVVAIVALLTHRFDSTDARLIATSLGFSVFSSLAAAGSPARRRIGLHVLGVLTTGFACLSYTVLEVGIWSDVPTWIWREFGVLVILALASSHASLVLSSRRGSDSRLVSSLALCSVSAASIDAALAAISVAGLIDHVSTDQIRFAAVLVIAMLLTTALPPILRRATSTVHQQGTRPLAGRTSGQLPHELQAIAERLELLACGAGDLTADLQLEATKVRQLAMR